MSRKSLLSLFTLSILLLGGSDLFAQRARGHGKHKGYEHKGMHFRGKQFNPEIMKNKLDLSQTQVEKIDQINLDFRKKHLSFMEKITPKEIRLKMILLEDEVDLKQVRLLLQEISDLRLEIRMNRIEHRFAIEKELTQAQKTKWRNSRKGMR